VPEAQLASALHDRFLHTETGRTSDLLEALDCFTRAPRNENLPPELRVRVAWRRGDAAAGSGRWRVAFKRSGTPSSSCRGSPPAI